MICPTCGKEMEKGYLFGSFANEVPGALENAKKAEGFVNHRAEGRRTHKRGSLPL